MYTLEHYTTRDGRIVYLEWHRKLRDLKAKLAISKRLERIELGNFGDRKYCRDGVWELRVNIGAGYRIYYAMAGASVVLFLCGGDKDAQSSDIDRACEYWRNYQGESDANRKP